MFESITFFNRKKAGYSEPLDIGALTECMLFYGKTIIVADRNILRQLFTFFGIERVIELIEEELMQIIYTESGLGVITKTINGIQYHDTGSYTSPQHTYEIELDKICIDIVGKTGKGRRTAHRIQRLIKVRKHDKKIPKNARKSFLDQEFINDSAKSILTSLIPEKIDVSNIEFHTEKTENGIIVDSNINFKEINQIYHKYTSPSHSTITQAHILSHVLDVESELYFSSKHNSEIATGELSAKLIAKKVNFLIKKSTNSSAEILAFQQFIFKNAKSLREAVNGRKIDLDDLIKVLKNSKQFKKWISGIDPDQDIIKNYYDEITKQTFIDKLSNKYIRWSIFTGTGLAVGAVSSGVIGALVSTSLSALDQFYFDKLSSGWKPNQFIEDEFKKLIENRHEDNDK